MDHAVEVGPRLENLGVNIDFAVTARRAGHHLALKVDGQDVLQGDLVEPHAVWLHEEQLRIVGKPHGNMAAGEIVVPLGHQHLAGHDHLLLDVQVSLVGLFGHFSCPQFRMPDAALGRRMMVRRPFSRNRIAACGMVAIPPRGAIRPHSF